MKIIITLLFIIMIALPVYSKDFKDINEGASKEDVIKKLGKPSKILKNEDSDFYEYWIWYEKDNTWVMLFENEQSTGAASTIEEFLSAFLELTSLFKEGDNTPLEVEKNVGESSSEEKLMELNALKKDIEISILDAQVIDTIFDERKAGFRLKIKNNTLQTIYKMRIVVYFYDRNGRIFYEETRTPIDSESWTDPITLKPNYSVIYPEANKSTYSTVDKMDIDEWDEGKISIKILEVESTPAE